MRLRTFSLGALLILNGVLLGSILGMPWLPANFGDAREPSRLADQTHPDAIALLPSGDIASAPATLRQSDNNVLAERCFEIGGWNAAQWEELSAERMSLRAQLAEAQIWDVEKRDGERLWVRLKPFADRSSAEDALATIREKGISDVSLVTDHQTGTSTISLGIFRDPARAERHQRELQARDIIAEVVPDPRAPSRMWLQVSGQHAELENVLTEFAARLAVAAPAPCQPNR
jgi:hypothetical protein